jgi:hypothetical protein
VGQLLKESGHSLQADRETRERVSQVDCDPQFHYVDRRVKAQRRRQPTTSVDTQERETPGNLKNPGRT